MFSYKAFWIFFCSYLVFLIHGDKTTNSKHGIEEQVIKTVSFNENQEKHASTEAGKDSTSETATSQELNKIDTAAIPPDVPKLEKSTSHEEAAQDTPKDVAGVGPDVKLVKIPPPTVTEVKDPEDSGSPQKTSEASVDPSESSSSSQEDKKEPEKKTTPEGHVPDADQSQPVVKDANVTVNQPEKEEVVPKETSKSEGEEIEVAADKATETRKDSVTTGNQSTGQSEKQANVEEPGAGEAESMPTFTEYQKMLAEEKQKHLKESESQTTGSVAVKGSEAASLGTKGSGGVGTGTTGLPGTAQHGATTNGAQHMQNNVASLQCGAKILEHSSSVSNAGAVLNSNKDDYLNQPCSSNKWFILETCEPVQLRTLEIANYELFSSRHKTFRVYTSDRYPVKQWHLLGTFTARDEKGAQSFEVAEDKYVKFIKFELLDHYGSEHYCPLSMVRLFGVTDDLDEEHDPAVAPSVPEENDSDEIERKDDAGGGGLLKKATTMLVNMVKQSFNKEKPSDQDSVKGSTEAGVGALGTRGVNASNETVPCPQDYNMVMRLLYQSPFSAHLRRCLTLLRDYHHLHGNRSTYLDNPLTREPFIPTPLRAYSACDYLRVMVNISTSQLSRLYFAYNNLTLDNTASDLTGETPENATAPVNRTLPHPPMPFAGQTATSTETESVTGTMQPDPSIHTRTDQDPVPPSTGTQRITDPVKPLQRDTLLPTSAEKGEPDVATPTEQNLNPPLERDEKMTIATESEAVLLNEKGTASNDKEAIFKEKLSTTGTNKPETQAETQESSDTSPPKDPSSEEVEPPTPVSAEVASEPSSDLPSSEVPPPTEDTNQRAPNTTPIAPVHVDRPPKPKPTKVLPSGGNGIFKKETAYMRLNNKLRLIEINVTVSMKYLEELSQSYRRQMDRHTKYFNLTLARLTETARSAEERDLAQQTRIADLEVRLNRLEEEVKKKSGKKEEDGKEGFVSQLLGLLILHLVVGLFAQGLLIWALWPWARRRLLAYLSALHLNLPLQNGHVTPTEERKAFPNGAQHHVSNSRGDERDPCFTPPRCRSTVQSEIDLVGLSYSPRPVVRPLYSGSVEALESASSAGTTSNLHLIEPSFSFDPMVNGKEASKRKKNKRKRSQGSFKESLDSQSTTYSDRAQSLTRIDQI